MIDICSQEKRIVLVKINKMNFIKLNEIHFFNYIRHKNKLLLRPTKSTGELKVYKEAIPT